ncbi:hypothetical protein GJ496_000750 [Pomphorhynchus laevis]|nr:hypothetical protein GJ496_000750 [Pomphorhynchus laevis]
MFDLCLTSSLSIVNCLEFGLPVKASDHVTVYIELEYFGIRREDLRQHFINSFKTNFISARNFLSDNLAEFLTNWDSRIVKLLQDDLTQNI